MCVTYLEFGSYFRFEAGQCFTLAGTPGDTIAMPAPALFKKTMRSAFTKCSALWNKLSRSDLTNDNVFGVTKKVLDRPVVTRWNSLLDSINSLLEFKGILQDIFAPAEIEPLKDKEILLFLEDYSKALKPITWALDTLQSEKHFYY